MPFWFKLRIAGCISTNAFPSCNWYENGLYRAEFQPSDQTISKSEALNLF